MKTTSVPFIGKNRIINLIVEWLAKNPNLAPTVEIINSNINVNVDNNTLSYLEFYSENVNYRQSAIKYYKESLMEESEVGFIADPIFCVRRFLIVDFNEFFTNGNILFKLDLNNVDNYNLEIKDNKILLDNIIIDFNKVIDVSKINEEDRIMYERSLDELPF